MATGNERQGSVEGRELGRCSAVLQVPVPFRFLCFLLFKLSLLASVTTFKGFVGSGVRREEVDLVSRQGDFRRAKRLLQIRYGFRSDNWKDWKRLP